MSGSTRLASSKRRSAQLIVSVLVVAFVGCSESGSSKAARSPSTSSASTWVLAEVPKDAAPDTYPAVEKMRDTQLFATFNDCENYRINAIQDAAAVGADTMLNADTTLRCIPYKPPKPTAPTK